MGNGTSRSLCSCTPAPHLHGHPWGLSPLWVCGSAGDQGLRQGGCWPGSGYVWRLPPQHAASCPCTPSLPAATPGPSPARATNTGQAARLQPSRSVPQHPKHPRREGQHPAPLRSPGCEARGAGKDRFPQAGLIEMNLISHVAAKLKIYKKFVVYKKVSVRTPASRSPPCLRRGSQRRRWHTEYLQYVTAAARSWLWEEATDVGETPGSPHQQ